MNKQSNLDKMNEYENERVLCLKEQSSLNSNVEFHCFKLQSLQIRLWLG